MKPRSSRTRRHHTEPPAQLRPRRLRRAAATAAGILAVAGLVWTALPGNDVQRQAKRQIAYYRNYSSLLTPEQLAIRNEALGAIPAPCCNEYSIATCCCPCNLARSVWGLASHLILERGYGVSGVQREVKRWLATINPQGAAGDACNRGRCERPFHEDGCGGMDQRRVL
jgi:hypothetical protein